MDNTYNWLVSLLKDRKDTLEWRQKMRNLCTYSQQPWIKFLTVDNLSTDSFEPPFEINCAYTSNHLKTVVPLSFGRFWRHSRLCFDRCWRIILSSFFIGIAIIIIISNSVMRCQLCLWQVQYVRILGVPRRSSRAKRRPGGGSSGTLSSVIHNSRAPAAACCSLSLQRNWKSTIKALFIVQILG